MNNKIHYDANIFYLGLIIRTIQKGCTLDTDSNFFLDKIVEDIMFSDKALKNLMEELNGSELLIDSEQHLRNLYLTKRELVLLLEDISGQMLPFAKHLKQYENRFTQIIRSQKTDMVEIDNMLSFDEQQADKKNMVSSEEYQILFDTEE